MRAFGQVEPINPWDLPLYNPADPAAWAKTLPVIPTEYEQKQFCVFGQFSEDPLIPGVCNLTTLFGAGVALVLFWLLMGRR